MNFLERFLGHDHWTTMELLKIASQLSNSQLDKEYDIGHRSIRNTFGHMIRNLEIWTDLMCDGFHEPKQGDSIERFIERQNNAYNKFELLAKDVEQNSRCDETWIAKDENPPKKRTFGGSIAHVITHSMHHRAQLLYMFRLSGAENIPEGDLLSWENSI